MHTKKIKNNGNRYVKKIKRRACTQSSLSFSTKTSATILEFRAEAKRTETMIDPMVLDSPPPLPIAHVVSVSLPAVSEQQPQMAGSPLELAGKDQQQPQMAGSPLELAGKDQPTLVNCTVMVVGEKQQQVPKDLTPSHFWLMCLDREMARRTVVHGLGILIPERKLSSPGVVAGGAVAEGLVCDPLLLHRHFPWVLFFKGLGLAVSDICTFAITTPGTDSRGSPAAQEGDIACFVKLKTARCVL